jgi:hypothetical protein
MPLTPTPLAGSYPIQIRVATTSDWTNVILVDGATFAPMEVTSSTPNVDAGWAGAMFHLNQPPGQHGVSVEVVTQGYLRDVTTTSTLHFRIERGDLGATTLVLAKVVNGAPVTVGTFVWAQTTGGTNPGDFTFPAKSLMP